MFSFFPASYWCSYRVRITRKGLMIQSLECFKWGEIRGVYPAFCFLTCNLMLDDQFWMNQEYMPSCYWEQKDPYLHPFISMLSGYRALCTVVDARNSGAKKQEWSLPPLNLHSSERRWEHINKIILGSESPMKAIKSNFIKWWGGTDSVRFGKWVISLRRWHWDWHFKNKESDTPGQNPQVESSAEAKLLKWEKI